MNVFYEERRRFQNTLAYFFGSILNCVENQSLVS
jgi:hypothetical protein